MSAEIYRIVLELEGRGKTRSERSVEKVSEEALARERSSRESRIASAATRIVASGARVVAKRRVPNCSGAAIKFTLLARLGQKSTANRW